MRKGPHLDFEALQGGVAQEDSGVGPLRRVGGDPYYSVATEACLPWISGDHFKPLTLSGIILCNIIVYMDCFPKALVANQWTLNPDSQTSDPQP